MRVFFPGYDHRNFFEYSVYWLPKAFLSFISSYVIPTNV